ncbi:MAG TPA: ATP-binding protein [Bryobacteraceae bacterium]|nr:ATP-binding protein [Bryobacteraceae bacterium]
MANGTRIRFGLAAKLAVCLVASTAAFFALFGYVMLREQQRYSEALMLQAADRVSDVIRSSTRYQMLHNDREALYHAIQEIGREPGIRRIRIFNKDGRISFSTDPAEVNTAVDKNAEQCYACHAQQQPLTKLDRPDRARIFREAQGGQRVLGVIRPVENAPECSNAACHSHPASQRVLGVIDAHVWLGSVDSQTRQYQFHLAGFMGMALLLVSLLSVVFIWVVVYRPVKNLIDGTRRVAGGDLSYRLPVGSDDELGDLASSFNHMTQEVSNVQAEIEERVRRKAEELSRVHKSLLANEKLASIGKLAATVAHEVNNPLFGILTYARLTLKELDKGDHGNREEMKEQLQVIERESKRCGDIMRNLLSFSRQAPSHPDFQHIGALIERAVVLVRHKAELQQIELRIQVAADLPQVYCDAGQVQQVILVLLVNATEAMAKGGLLEVSADLAQDGEAVCIRVKDNGPGIAPDVLSKIFEPFFTTKEEQQRTGLGLAVARGIVEQHGGEITVRSTLGEGTEFSVTLPVATPVAAAASGTGQAEGTEPVARK